MDMNRAERKIITTETINFDWFETKYRETFVNEGVYNKLPAMIEQLDDVYGENWDFQVRVENGYYYPRFVIKFDELTVKNSENRAIEIRDLYVILDINNTGGIKDVSGIRGELSFTEFMSCYQHSHLSTSYVGSKEVHQASFCLGSEGVAQTIAMLSGNWSAPLFKMLLLQLMDFVAWESIEGGPYIKMENVFNKSTQSKIVLSAEDINTIRKAIDDLLHVTDFEFCIDNGGVAVIDDEEFQDKIHKLLPPKYLVRIDETGKKYAVEGFEISSEEVKVAIDFVWKGVPLDRVKITNRTPLHIDYIKYGVFDDVAKAITDYLITKLKLKLIEHEE